MKKSNIKRAIALAAALTACMTISTGVYTPPQSYVHAAVMTAHMTDVSARKTVIAIGEKVPIEVTWSNGAKQEITYSSDNEAVLTVDSDGVVTGISAGKATVTLTIESGQTKTIDFIVDSKITASVVYETSSLEMYQTVYASDILHYDGNNKGGVLNIVTEDGYKVEYPSEKDYILPFSAQVVGIDGGTIYLLPMNTGIDYMDVRKLKEGDILPVNRHLICGKYTIKIGGTKYTYPVFLSKYYKQKVGDGSVIVKSIDHDNREIEVGIDEYSIINDVIPSTYEEVDAMVKERGNVFLYSGYVVYAEKESGSTGYRACFEKEGAAELECVLSLSYDYNPEGVYPPAPGTPCYSLKIYRATVPGVMKATFSQKQIYTTDHPVFNEIVKYYKISKYLTIEEITHDDYHEGALNNDVEFKVNKHDIVITDNDGVNLSVVVSSTWEYDMTRQKDGSFRFVPIENGFYVLSVETTEETIITSGDKHSHYFYPIVVNYFVTNYDGELVVEKQGQRNYYSSYWVEQEKQKLNDEPDYDCGTLMKTESCIDDGAYHSYVGKTLAPIDYEFRWNFTTRYNGNNVESLATITYITMNPANFDGGASWGETECINFDGVREIGSSCGPDLNNVSPDSRPMFVFSAVKDGITCIKTDDIRLYVEVKDGAFRCYEREWDYGAEVPPSIKAILPKNLKAYNNFVDKYGAASVHGSYIIFCDDINGSTDEKLELIQDGTASFKKVMEYTVDDDTVTDGAASHTVIVYKPLKEGRVRATWEQGIAHEWNVSKETVDVRYFVIDSELKVTEYTKENFMVKGDANGDGEFTVADLLAVSKYVLGEGNLTFWENVDWCSDEKIDAFDLCEMRRMYVQK